MILTFLRAPWSDPGNFLMSPRIGSVSPLSINIFEPLRAVVEQFLPPRGENHDSAISRYRRCRRIVIFRFARHVEYHLSPSSVIRSPRYSGFLWIWFIPIRGINIFRIQRAVVEQSAPARGRKFWSAISRFRISKKKSVIWNRDFGNFRSLFFSIKKLFFDRKIFDFFFRSNFCSMKKISTKKSFHLCRC